MNQMCTPVTGSVSFPSRLAGAAPLPSHGGQAAVIADDDEFFRMAVAALLVQTFGFDRVIQTGSFPEALAAIAAEGRVGLALFDLDMPGMSGPAALHDLRESCTSPDKVAIVSASRRREDIIGTLTAGLHGYVCKASGVRELSEALGHILGGRIYVPCLIAEIEPAAPCAAAPPAATVSAIAATDPAPPMTAQGGAAPALSPRQSRVLEMLVDGKSNKEIARELNLGAGTVKVHMAALFAKLGVANRASAAVAGTRMLGA